MAKNLAAAMSAQRIRNYRWNVSRTRRVYEMTADDVIALVKSHVRRTMGDKTENNTTIFASAGFFYVRLPIASGRVNAAIKDKNWRQMLKAGIYLRRVSIGLALRAMHGEVLTDC